MRKYNGSGEKRKSNKIPSACVAINSNFKYLYTHFLLSLIAIFSKGHEILVQNPLLFFKIIRYRYLVIVNYNIFKRSRKSGSESIVILKYNTIKIFGHC